MYLSACLTCLAFVVRRWWQSDHDNKDRVDDARSDKGDKGRPKVITLLNLNPEYSGQTRPVPWLPVDANIINPWEILTKF